MNNTPRRKSNSGFTLIESLVAILVLMIVMAGVFTEINKAQTYYRVEGQKVDVTQAGRTFIDNFTREMHQAGFPTVASVGPANAASAAQGLTNFTNTQLTFDGDLDGTGVQTVTYNYDAAGCQCITRTTTAGGGGASTAVDNLTAASFTGYDKSGSPTTVPSQIRSIGVSLTVQNGLDANNRAPVQITMTGMARLPNND